MEGKITLMGVFFVFLIANGCSYTTSQNTCGGQYEGLLSLHGFTNSNSHQIYKIDPGIMKYGDFHYQQRFCTCKRDGILAKFTDSKTKRDIILEITDGRLSVEFIGNGQTTCLYTWDSKAVSDCQSHTTDLQFHGGKLIFSLIDFTGALSIKDTKHVTSCIEGGDFSTFQILELGGEIIDYDDNEIPVVWKNFNGCFTSDALINSIPLSRAANLTISSDVEDDCLSFGANCTNLCPLTYVRKGNTCQCPEYMKISEFGVCVSSCDCLVCENGGRCHVNSEGKPQCTCAPNFEGNVCERQINPCLNFNCENNGQCALSSIRGVRKPECRCPSNFTGDKCEKRLKEDLTPCQDNPCKNNGTCETHDASEKTFSCSCFFGYSGELCEIELDSAAGKLNWEVWLAIIMGSIVTFSGIVGFLCYLYGIRRRQQFSKPSKSQETGVIVHPTEVHQNQGTRQPAEALTV